MDKKQRAKYIDHTILKADANYEDIDKLCEEALQFGFASVCVNPYYVKRTYEILKDSEVKVCTVIGFPLGVNSTNVKVFETIQAITDGASEVDMVINIGAVKSGDYKTVEQDINDVTNAAKKQKNDIIVKVIIETALLTQDEKTKVITLLLNTKADFVKTSTGFSTNGATEQDIKLMKSIVGDNLKIKASGGVRDFATFELMINAGADRVGTSNGITITND